MVLRLLFRTVRTVDRRCLARFCWNFGVKGVVAIERFKRRLKRGEHFPPFLHLSITNACNLRCQGCWVDVTAPVHAIEAATLDRLIRQAKTQGNVFFGILGGEPFMHPGLYDLLAAHPDCYFQIFTNGQFLTESTAGRLRQLANATPLISIEGLEGVSDERRGGREVYQRTLRGLDHALAAGLLTGVATSVCQSNFDDLLSESWLDRLIQRGVHYVWYHTYRPVGPVMRPELALRPDQLVAMRRFVARMRARKAIAIVDAYNDADGHALCPMVTGICQHIGPYGDIEPCPVLQFAVERIEDPRGIVETIRSSAFLRDFREQSAAITRGCILLERPDVVRDLVQRHGARDTTLRRTALAELDAMTPRYSQWLPGQEVPEAHWAYRIAKRFWFSDFKAYRRLGADARARAIALQQQLGTSPQATP
ncbi:MAG TPA: radical SAM protein [Verrucomicrobiota bacterium]|nr:radical SAM protein [Verrucomicrobiota bacterium]HNU52542.1 radical SAM protein [Verrucomicrobiota bacterium]